MSDPVLKKVLKEQGQSHETRRTLFRKIENKLNKPVLTYFTSFFFPVMINDSDADMLEGLLQTMDLSDGFILMICSPGGDGLAAERIIKICRSYSGTGEYLTIVPGQAKSAATMICFGSSKIIMGKSSELGPIDPQITIREADTLKRYSVYDLIKSYNELFEKAVQAHGNIQPYLQQLNNYDQRDIAQMEREMELSEDIAIKSLSSGMMNGLSDDEIRKNIKIFLTTEQTKTHRRPIYAEEAEDCGLEIECLDTSNNLWRLIYELHTRTSNYVNRFVAKSIENKTHSYYIEKQE